MEIFLMRHGETPGNARNCYSGGGSDEPLSPVGERLARASGVHPEVETVYVTPMLRTKQTARICFPNAGQTVVEGLQEMHFGDFEGRTADEMEHDADYRAWVDGGCVGVCPNGESIESFGRRVYGAFVPFVQSLLDAGDTRAFVVMHGGTITALLKLFADPERSFYEWFMPNCGGYRVVIDEDVWQKEKRFSAYESFPALPV